MASLSRELFLITLLLPPLLTEGRSLLENSEDFEKRLLENEDFEKVAAELNENIKKAFLQIRKQSDLSLADKANIKAPLRKIDCDDEEETMEALKLLSPEELAMPRGLEDINKVVKYVTTIINAMRKSCYYKRKSAQ